MTTENPCDVESDKEEIVHETQSQLAESSRKVSVKLGRARQVDQWFMATRVVFFLLIGFGFFLTAFREDDRFGWFMMMPSMVAFIAVVRLHRPHREVLARLNRLKSILLEKTSRLNSEMRPEAPSDFISDCSRLAFTEPRFDHQNLAHYVMEDLGVFHGRANLFGLLWTGHTRMGSIQLGNWLRQPATECNEIRLRQRAAQEFMEDKVFREKTEQDFAAIGKNLEDEHLSALKNDNFKIDSEDHKLTNWIGTSAVIAILVSAFIFSSTLCFFVTFVAVAFLNRYNARSLEQIPRYREFLAGIRPVLRKIRVLESRLEKSEFSCSRIKELHGKLKSATDHPELPIHEIEKRLRLLSIYKLGLVYVVFSWLTLFDLHVLPRVLKGFRNHRQVFLDAFDAMGELEVLLCFCMVLEEQSGWTWPDISEPSSAIAIDAGIHPFLPIEDVRANSLSLNQEHGVLVITGSNMSGKSTFLKMCGLNQLLAQCGAPVRATSMTTAPHLIHTDINVRDSLDDGRSYFAVEVQRIKDVIDDLEAGVPTFSLLDEMFRGTNTNEKVAAGIEVTRWIASHHGKALVATHDAPFTQLEEIQGLGIRNFHFTEEIQDGKMVFDYRLRTGRAKSSNAIRVLEIEGYPEELVRNALENARRHD